MLTRCLPFKVEASGTTGSVQCFPSEEGRIDCDQPGVQAGEGGDTLRPRPHPSGGHHTQATHGSIGTTHSLFQRGYYSSGFAYLTIKPSLHWEKPATKEPWPRSRGFNTSLGPTPTRDAGVPPSPQLNSSSPLPALKGAGWGDSGLSGATVVTLGKPEWGCGWGWWGMRGVWFLRAAGQGRGAAGKISLVLKSCSRTQIQILLLLLLPCRPVCCRCC